MLKDISVNVTKYDVLYSKIAFVVPLSNICDSSIDFFCFDSIAVFYIIDGYRVTIRHQWMHGRWRGDVTINHL